MLNRDWVSLPPRRRRRRYGELQSILDRSCTTVPVRLREWLERTGTTPRPCIAEADWTAAVLSRLRTPLQHRFHFFGAGPGGRLGALYLPSQSTVLLNANLAATDSLGFLDALEHEWCHHLFPSVTLDTLGRNPWWEGFNEAVAEWLPLLETADPGTVEYPVQTALACLVLDHSPSATLCFLSGGIEMQDLAEALDSTGTPVGRSLAAVAAEAKIPGPERIRRAEAMLRAWGWREDDGGDAGIGHLLTRDGFEDRALANQYRRDRAFLRDALDALAITHIQDLSERHPRREIEGSVSRLPAHLTRNLGRTLRYAVSPDTSLNSLSH
jgi:hypothetical protein